MTFYNRRWEPLGSKQDFWSLLSKITGVPHRILQGLDSHDQYSVAQRMSWASKRVTTRPEDRAYCLMGIFDVNMSLLYGEGEKAFWRLQEEIMRQTHDHSMFAWSRKGYRGPRDLLARSPVDFIQCSEAYRVEPNPEQYSITNTGLSISLSMLPWAMYIYLAVLECRHETAIPYSFIHDTRSAIFLERSPETGQFRRIAFLGQDICTIKRAEVVDQLKTQRISILPRDRWSTAWYARMEPYGFDLAESPFDIGPEALRGAIISSRNPPQRLSGSGRWHVKLLPGQHGTVAWIKFSASDKAPSKIGLVKLGFDFNFNPVCMLWTSDQLSRDRAANRQGEAAKTSVLDTNDWIEKEVASYGIDGSLNDLEVRGELQPYYAFRGHSTSGLRARIPALEFSIKIDRPVLGRDAWIVEMEPIGSQEGTPTNDAQKPPNLAWLSKKDIIVAVD